MVAEEFFGLGIQTDDLEILRWFYIVAFLGILHTIMHLGFRLVSLVELEDILGSSQENGVRLLLHLIRLESIVALFRILAALAVGVVFVGWISQTTWNVELLGEYSQIWLLRLSIAAGCVVFGTKGLQVYAEFFLRYKLDPRLGST